MGAPGGRPRLVISRAVCVCVYVCIVRVLCLWLFERLHIQLKRTSSSVLLQLSGICVYESVFSPRDKSVHVTVYVAYMQTHKRMLVLAAV